MKKYKRIGWAIQMRESTRHKFTTYHQFTTDQRTVAIELYNKYRKDGNAFNRDRDRGLMRCVPVYIEDAQ